MKGIGRRNKMENIITTLTTTATAMTIIIPIIIYTTHKFLFLDFTTSSNGWRV
jgi:hypothetical protein